MMNEKTVYNEKICKKTILLHPIHLLSFGFGSGLIPKAPGTFGTLTAIPIFILLSQTNLSIYLASCLIISIAGIYFCGFTAKKLDVHDHPGIVWDEIAGFLITMIGFSITWQNILLGFCLFRLFDILKPWPISWLDSKVSGGLGIMLDDVVAGVFSWCCLYGINQYGVNLL